MPAQPKHFPDDTIHGHGLRMTDQRRAVYDVLMGERNHPTAVEVFTKVRGQVPNISLATVYKCLETLSGCGLVKTVTHERGPARYCPNLKEHAHFFCDNCGGVSDLPLRLRRRPEDVWEVPERLTILHHEVAFRGVCPKCASRKKQKTENRKQKSK